MSEGRSQALFERAAPLRRACLEHPFVRGMADGSLPPETFARWIVQDWHYLHTYIDVLTTLATSAPPRAASRWRSLASFTRDEELDLHRALAESFGLTPSDLARARVGAVTRAYTAFLRASVRRSYGEGVAALCPCGVGYLELARGLAAAPASPESRYAQWIASYQDPAFADAVAFMTAELDAAPGEDATLAATYLQGARFELAFWRGLWEGDDGGIGRAGESGAGARSASEPPGTPSGA